MSDPQQWCRVTVSVDTSDGYQRTITHSSPAQVLTVGDLEHIVAAVQALAMTTDPGDDETPDPPAGWAGNTFGGTQ